MINTNEINFCLLFEIITNTLSLFHYSSTHDFIAQSHIHLFTAFQSQHLTEFIPFCTVWEELRRKTREVNI